MLAQYFQVTEMNNIVNLTAKQKAILSYRYVSWFATSLFYLTDKPFNSLYYKIVVVAALLVFSRIISDSYLKGPSRRATQTTIMMETAALTIFLIPTGGIESPFIWYALNPVFIAANYLRPIYCWLNLGVYLTSAVAISSSLFNSNGMTVAQIIQNSSYIILVYLLVTVAMMLLARLVTQLDRQTTVLEEQRQELLGMNQKLQEANKRVTRSMEHVMSLYHIIETLSLRTDTRFILQHMVKSTAQIMESSAAFLWLAPQRDGPSDLITGTPISSSKEELDNCLNDLAAPEPAATLHEFTSGGVKYLLAAVKSSSRLHGHIGIEVPDSPSSSHEFPDLKLFAFLAELIVLVLERNHINKVASKLMIMEEQNRIANEIHDNVSQRLFSILCGIHALSGKWNQMDIESVNRFLRLIEQSAREASSELRSSIYHLSPSKRGEKILKDSIQNYLSDFAHLNNASVKFQFDGDGDRMTSAVKQAIYRIVLEAVGNAVRHGRSSQVEVRIVIDGAAVELVVKDNGRGFNVTATLKDRDSRGLGINNMQALTQSLNGKFAIRSEPGVGTELIVKVPVGQRENIEQRQGGVA